jgi:hypothetical protein
LGHAFIQANRHDIWLKGFKASTNLLLAFYGIWFCRLRKLKRVFLSIKYIEMPSIALIGGPCCKKSSSAVGGLPSK